MLQRKIETALANWKRRSSHALLVTGARQVGKSYSIRAFGTANYGSFVEFNLFANGRAKQVLSGAEDATDLINRIALLAETELVEHDTLIFFDEIQEYPDIVTMAKALVEDGRYSYVFSGSMLGTEFKGIRSFPVGYVEEITMRPLDFEEFCWALSIPRSILDSIRDRFDSRTPVETYVHEQMLKNFRSYLLVGGMPEVVQQFLDQGRSIPGIRALQNELVAQYRVDIGKYAAGQALRVREIFDHIPLQLEEPEGRFILSSLGKDVRFERWETDFLWLVNAGVALKTECVSEAKSPLRRTRERSKFKLYQSDTGMLLSRYPMSTARALYLDERTPNLGGIYENAVAQELAAQSISAYYFMTAQTGEVDFIFEGISGRVVPLEVKSGRRFRSHAALDKLLANKETRAREGFVLCRNNVAVEDKVVYLPFYMTFCLNHLTEQSLDDFVIDPWMPGEVPAIIGSKGPRFDQL